MLTEQLIKNLEVKDKEYLVKDSSNLYLRVLPSGTKTWQFETTKGGNRVRLSLGLSDLVTPEDARELRTKAIRLVNLDVQPTLTLLYSNSEEDESKLDDYLLDQQISIERDKKETSQEKKDLKKALQRVTKLEDELAFYKEAEEGLFVL